MRKHIFTLIFTIFAFGISAQTHISISNPETWTVSELAPYVGKVVIFDTPLIVTSNYKYIYVSPRRIFSVTNQAYPRSDEYYALMSLNSQASMPILNLTDYHRTGEKIYNLKAQVGSGSLTMIDGEWRGNTRADLEAELPNIDLSGEHTLLVCGANLEYYLAEQFSSPGPANEAEHYKQRVKVSKALARINADIYGLVEIQQGNTAMKEIADDLKKNTGRNFDYIPDKAGANGTYTKSSFVYCSDVVEPVGTIQEIESGVRNRKKMQVFRELSTGETFIFSINHFKAKSGNGSGADADQGDGQSGFNATRVGEANAIIAKYEKLKGPIAEEDILIMGDLNAYAKEDPITTLIQHGMTDLHRYYHADSSYSYTYRSEAGYLDHAICNSTMLPQITGVAAYHVNSDESDAFTYDKSDDKTMFRYSDHDPVLVGLRLDKNKEEIQTIGINSWEVLRSDGNIVIRNDAGITRNIKDSPAYYRLYTIDGRMLLQEAITDYMQTVARPMQSGVYILMIYHEGQTYKWKVIVP